MRVGKKGAMGEGVIMIYRLLLVSFIAFIILGISSVFYVHYIDVRDVEAKILARDIVECVSPNGIIDLSKFSEEDKGSILSYCGFEVGEVERFYVEVSVTDSNNNEIKLSQGDAGALWVLSLFENKVDEGLKKYNPGHYVVEYLTNVIVDGDKLGGNMRVEVFVKDEF